MSRFKCIAIPRLGQDNEREKEEQQADILYQLKTTQPTPEEEEPEHNPAGDDKQ